jgi:adenylate kinase
MVTKLARAARIILVGAPGVGKGTQTERLIKRYPQVSPISSGDLLRDNVRNRTPLGKMHFEARATIADSTSTGIKAEAKMRAGELLPDTMMLRLIHGELRTRGWLLPYPEPMNLNSTATSASVDDADSDNFITTADSTSSTQTVDEPGASFILDGFPRTAAQAKQIDASIDINWVVSLQTPKSIIMDRICNRWIHAPSGRIYNTTFNPPKEEGKDDITGEALTRRSDDDPKTWEARLAKFQETSQSLLEHYDQKGVLWTVQGDSSDEISPKLFKEFERRFL